MGINNVVRLFCDWWHATGQNGTLRDTTIVCWLMAQHGEMHNLTEDQARRWVTAYSGHFLMALTTTRRHA